MIHQVPSKLRQQSTPLSGAKLDGAAFIKQSATFKYSCPVGSESSGCVEELKEGGRQQNLPDSPDQKTLPLPAVELVQLQPGKPGAFTVSDMDPSDQKLTGWRLLKKLHEAAVEDDRDMYIDPPTGYTVFTARCIFPSTQRLKE